MSTVSQAKPTRARKRAAVMLPSDSQVPTDGWPDLRACLTVLVRMIVRMLVEAGDRLRASGGREPPECPAPAGGCFARGAHAPARRGSFLVEPPRGRRQLARGARRHARLRRGVVVGGRQGDLLLVVEVVVLVQL